MKKLFISCPMKGRTEENIRNSMERMHKMAEAVFDQELEAIPTYIKDAPPKDNNQALWYLGESVKKLSQADYFIGVTLPPYNNIFRGCSIENHAAQQYGIPSKIIPMKDVMRDYDEKRYKDADLEWDF